jgi:GNAT superfamily N-acetyltransferase
MLIRHARPDDGPAFLELVSALADYERLPGPDASARARLLDDAFGPRPRFELLVAEEGGRVVAYAVHFEVYSTFRARPGLFLEDLFVHPGFRRRGIARALLGHLRQLAQERGYGRMEWMVLDWNEDAQGLYKSVGARMMETWRLNRIELAPPGQTAPEPTAP